MWFTGALIVGVVVTLLFFLLRNKNIKVAWYEMLIAIGGIALILFGLQNYIGFKAEFEPEASTTSLLIMGLPGVILLAVAVLLVLRRKNAAS